MKKAKKMLAVMGCAAMLLSGCTQSNIVTPSGEAAAPDFSIKEDVQIVWEQVYEDLGESFMESEDYPNLEQIGFNVNEEEKMVNLEVLVSEETTKEEAVSYATALVKAINDEVQIQSAYYEASSEESYGGFFKEYGFHAVVAPIQSPEDESTYLVNDTVAAGEERAIQATE
ncbi:MAG: hypothetical protein ACOX8K_05505 [Lachnospiraceae bacterium]